MERTCYLLAKVHFKFQSNRFWSSLIVSRLCWVIMAFGLLRLLIGRWWVGSWTRDGNLGLNRRWERNLGLDPQSSPNSWLVFIYNGSGLVDKWVSKLGPNNFLTNYVSWFFSSRYCACNIITNSILRCYFTQKW